MRRALLLVVAAALAGCAGTATHRSPDLAGRKPTLGRIAVTSDFVALRELPGATDEIGIEDSRRQGDAVLAVAVAVMKSKGYEVGPNCVASVGQALNPSDRYVVVDSLGQRVRADTASVKAPPFALDDTFRDRVTAAHWARLVRELWAMPAPRRGSGAPKLPDAVELRGPLGGEVACVITGLGWTSAPRRRRDPLVLAESGYAGWHQSYGVVQLALLDARTGELLWMQARRTRRPVTPTALATVVRDLVRALP